MSDIPRPPDGPDEQELDGTPAERAAAKRKLLLSGLEHGIVHIILDARTPGVRVPPQYATDPELVLKLSYRFPNADLVVNERGVVSTLRFSGQPFRCAIPWAAVWGMLLQGMAYPRVWESDQPRPGSELPVRRESPAAPIEPTRPKLQLVSESTPEAVAEPDWKEEAPSDAAPAEPAEEKKPKAPWLRLVR